MSGWPGSESAQFMDDDHTAYCLDRARIRELEAALRTVRQAIIDKADDTFWLSEIETVVDHIDGVLGGFADAQTELRI